MVGTGDLGLHAAPALKRALLDHVGHDGCHLIVDLTRAEAFDATTLGILVGVHVRLVAAGGGLTVVGGAQLRSALRLTGLDEIFAVASSVGQVVSEAPDVARAGSAALVP